MTKQTQSAYALGYTEDEHNRLMRQAALLAPCTERLFEAAGIGAGDRVLDLGSGIGDVSLLLSKLVGPTGMVVGVERDEASIAKAEARAAAAGLRNVSFVQSEAADPHVTGAFDAIVGRFILMYLPDPATVLRGLCKRLHPRGAVAFLEPSWAAARGLSAHLPLYSACVTTIVESFKACGVNPEIGPALYRTFLDAGLPPPTMNVEMMLGADAEFTGALFNILRSLEPSARKSGISYAQVGDLGTLQERLNAEIMESRDPIPWLASHVGAWCHTTEPA